MDIGIRSEIEFCLKSIFGDKPAFLFGSRVNGYETEKSDWDVCIINGHRELIKIGEKYDLRSLEADSLNTMDIHHKDFAPFAKSIIPINQEPVVKSMEYKVKLNIANYFLKKLNVKPNNITGMEIVLNYLQEEAIFNPFHKPKIIRFIKNEEYLNLLAEQYDAILCQGGLPFAANYLNSPLYTSGPLTSMVVRIGKAAIRNPYEAVKASKNALKEYPKYKSINILKYYPKAPVSSLAPKSEKLNPLELI